MISKAGYEEIEHTADRAVRVWGPDMAAFLHQAALGMYFLMGIDPGSDGEETKEVAIAFADDEILLVEFLSELLSWLDCSPGSESPFETTGKTTMEVLSCCAGSLVAEIDVVFSGSAVSKSDSWVASGVKVDVEATGEIKLVVDVEVLTKVFALIG